MSKILASIKGKLKGNAVEKKKKKVRVKSKTVSVEYGWVNFSEAKNKYFQVRRPSGGTFSVPIGRMASYQQLLEMGKSKFFRNGSIRDGKRNAEDFEFHLSRSLDADFLPEGFVLEDYIEKGVKNKYYLCTKQNEVCQYILKS